MGYYVAQKINVDVTDIQWQSFWTRNGSFSIKTCLVVIMEVFWLNLPAFLIKLFYMTPLGVREIILELHRISFEKMAAVLNLQYEISCHKILPTDRTGKPLFAIPDSQGACCGKDKYFREHRNSEDILLLIVTDWFFETCFTPRSIARTVFKTVVRGSPEIGPKEMKWIL
jgi:hypothetical protein